MNLQQILSDQASCSDLLKCAYSLGDAEIEAYRLLSDEGPMRTEEIASSMAKKPSTVYRSLQRMLSCGMVTRETRNIEGGGYYYLYRAKAKETLKAELRERMGNWNRRMEELLQRFEEEL